MAALNVLRKFKRHDAIIDITYVSNREIKALNSRYMHRRSATDVLSFLLEAGSPCKRRALLGDIYISSDMAHENAGQFITSYSRELLLYTVHGVLHLLGFDDKTVAQKAKIRRLEDKFLNELTGTKT
ncbi:MAG: rRNA maturation RNase YbeY [Candidatus Omnitrophota bacterium]